MASVIGLLLLGGWAAWAARARRLGWATCLLLVATLLALGLPWVGLGARALFAFAPDLAWVVMAALLLLCVPALMHLATKLQQVLLATRCPKAPAP